MRRPHPLPSELRTGIFTREQAIQAGVSLERLRRQNILRVGRGRYLWHGIVSGSPTCGRTWSDQLAQDLARLSPTTQRSRWQAALVALPGSALSHTTAAQLRSWWLPHRLTEDPRVRLSRPLAALSSTRKDVVVHRRRLLTSDLTRVEGHLTTSVERTWLDLAQLMSATELTVLGDSLVRQPYTWAATGRSTAWTSVAKLREHVASSAGVRGVRIARQAVDLIRDGADSPPESWLSLALVAAGLPEPEFQIELWDPEYSHHIPVTADLGYRQWKIALHYEGTHHHTAAQLRHDILRGQIFTRHGWRNLRLGAADSREGFRGAVNQVS